MSLFMYLSALILSLCIVVESFSPPQQSITTARRNFVGGVASESELRRCSNYNKLCMSAGEAVLPLPLVDEGA